MKPAIHLAFSDNGEHIRFWTASEGHASEWARENRETEPFFSGAQMAAAQAEIDVLAYWGPRWEAEHKEKQRLQKLLQQVLADAQAQDVLLEWWHLLECETVPNDEVSSGVKK